MREELRREITQLREESGGPERAATWFQSRFRHLRSSMGLETHRKAIEKRLEACWPQVEAGPVDGDSGPEGSLGGDDGRPTCAPGQGQGNGRCLRIFGAC